VKKVIRLIRLSFEVNEFISRVSKLMRDIDIDIDIAILSVCRLSVCLSVRTAHPSITYRHVYGNTIMLVLGVSNIFAKFPACGKLCISYRIKILKFSTNKSLYLVNNIR